MVEIKVNERFRDKQYEILCVKTGVGTFSCTKYCCFSEQQSNRYKTTLRLFCSKCVHLRRTDSTSVNFVINKSLFSYDRTKD